jgi:hypothetical protein
MFSSSMRMRMSSTTAMAGWVSLSCTATLSAKLAHELPGGAEVAADDVAQRAGDEKILLHEAQLFAVLSFVVRVKHL